MFSASVKVNVDPAAIAKKAAIGEAQRWLDSRIVQDTDQFVPMDSGMLAASPRRATDFGGGRVVYDTPYARKQYHGVNFNFSRDKHPKATHHWIEKAKSIFMDAWGAGVAKILGGKWRRGA